MRKIITSALVFALVACASAAFGGQAWTDANGDGVADSAPIISTVSSIVTIDLWIDSQSFTYTSFIAWAEWNNAQLVPGSAVNTATGCGNDPVDTFTHPQGVGVASTQCAPPRHGVANVARFQLHIDALPANVHPIIDPANPFGVFSLLIAPGGGYMLFSTASGSTFISEIPDATEDKSWGQIKGLYQ